MSRFFCNFALEFNLFNHTLRFMITQEQLKETFERKLALRRYL